MKPRLRFMLLTLSFMTSGLFGCWPTEGNKSAHDGESLPRLYWKVEAIGIGAQNPEQVDGDHQPRLYADGRVLSWFEERASGLPSIRSTAGTWTEVKPPAAESGAAITWYEDENNLGGYFYASPAHGFAVVAGKRHTYQGPPGLPRGLMPDGSVLLDAYAGGYEFFLKWSFGQDSLDQLDIHDYFYEDESKSRRFARLAANGTFMLVQAPAKQAEQAVIDKDGKAQDVGYSQFNRHEPLNLDQESIIPCCRITTIDRVNGGILGIKNGKPVIKKGNAYDQVSDEDGDPLALNGRGDVVFVAADARGGHAPRMRYQGKLYQFEPADWNTLPGFAAQTSATGLPTVVDMNESGQVLFFAPPRAAGEKGVRLYFATPTLSEPPANLYASVTFALKSGKGPAPDAMRITNPLAVTGSFGETSLTLNLTVPTEVEGKNRSLFLFVSNGSRTPLLVDSAIALTTQVKPTGIVTVTVSYADGLQLVAGTGTGGNLTVTSKSVTGGFEARLQDVTFKTQDGTVFTANGDVTVP